MKTESTVVDLHPTLASDLKQVELNTGTDKCESLGRLVTYVCTKCNKKKCPMTFTRTRRNQMGYKPTVKRVLASRRRVFTRKRYARRKLKMDFKCLFMVNIPKPIYQDSARFLRM